MAEFLIGAGGLVLLAALVGLYRALRGPAMADRMMAVQLLSSGGIAALLLIAAGLGQKGVVDVALVLALLGGFASVAVLLAARVLTQR